MELLNTLITTCALGSLLSLFVVVFSLNLAYMARKWFRNIKVSP